MRRLIGGMPGMLLAALILMARLIAPSMAMPGTASTADAFTAAALQSICHAGPLDDRAADHGDPAPSHADCMLCPACHLAGQLALPGPDAELSGGPVRALIGRAAPLPPATGPPGRPRLSAQPTGPPSRSV